MDKNKMFKDIYDDFFGNGINSKDNYKVSENIEKKNNDIKAPLQEENNYKKVEKVDKEEYMKDLFERIEKLYIDEQSKNKLKNIIEYMKRFNDKKEEYYIKFNLCVISTNNEDIYEITDIIEKTSRIYNYIKNGNTIELSMYNLEKAEQINEIYNDKNSIILLKDIEGFNNNEALFKNRFLYNLEHIIDKNDNAYFTIINFDNIELMNNFFESNIALKKKYFEYELNAVNPDIQDVMNEVVKKLKEENITEEFRISLLDYITVTYPNTTLSYPEYRDKLVNEILFNKKDNITKYCLPKYEKEKDIDEIFEELNELVGLKKVKEVLQDLVSLIELKNKTEGKLKIKDTNLHMIFLGNPGTGKTTVARIVAKILYNLKYIKQDKLIEVSSKDLVAEYVGQTAPKTMAVIQKAMGGVLFIDEAYSLASGKGSSNSYNEEAVATLIQAMENYRDELVVIFAGYTKEMQDFLNSNSGIVSRIGYTLEFEDYTEDELIEIFKSMLKKAGFEIEEAAIEKVREIINEYKKSKNFGNARFIRNLYEKTVIRHATNTKSKKQSKVLKTIKKEDINVDNLLKM